MEKRKSPRQRSFLRGFVRLGDQNYSMGCVVRDFSQTGAKLRFKSSTSFVGHVELHIPEMQRVIQARVVWTDRCEVGIAFDNSITIAEPANEAPVDTELLERVARLEAELTALKQMLVYMQKPGHNKVDAA